MAEEAFMREHIGQEELADPLSLDLALNPYPVSSSDDDDDDDDDDNNSVESTVFRATPMQSPIRGGRAASSRSRTPTQSHGCAARSPVASAAARTPTATPNRVHFASSDTVGPLAKRSRSQ
jgi:hypothetical protein